MMSLHTYPPRLRGYSFMLDSTLSTLYTSIAVDRGMPYDTVITQYYDPTVEHIEFWLDNGFRVSVPQLKCIRWMDGSWAPSLESLAGPDPTCRFRQSCCRVVRPRVSYIMERFFWMHPRYQINSLWWVIFGWYVRVSKLTMGRKSLWLHI